MAKIPATLEGIKRFALEHRIKLHVSADPTEHARYMSHQGAPFYVAMQTLEYFAETLHEHTESGRAFVPQRIVMVGYTNGFDDRAYSVALHEFGHVMSGHTQNHVGSVAYEREAWEWARKHAAHWSPAMDEIRAEALGSYEEGLRLGRSNVTA